MTYSTMLVHATKRADGTCPNCARASCSGTHKTFAGDTLFEEIRAAASAGNLAELSELQRVVRELADDGSSSVVPAAGTSLSAGVPAAAAPSLELVDEPELVVRVSGGTMSRICAEIYATTRVDGLETGGLLYASVHGDALEIEVASGVGDDAVRTEVSIKHETEYLVAFDRELQRDDLYPVGRWHTHPYLPGNDRNWRTPSKDDRRGMESCFRAVEDADAWTSPASVELIFTSPEYAKGDWADPDVNAFVARRDPVTHRVTVQNARIEED